MAAAAELGLTAVRAVQEETAGRLQCRYRQEVPEQLLQIQEELGD